MIRKAKKSKLSFQRGVNRSALDAFLYHSLNRSSSKQQYSIPQATRFGKRNAPDWSNIGEGSGRFYNLPDLLPRRGVSMGNALRFSKQNTEVTPSPNKYYQAHDWVDRRRAKSFAFGRSKSNFNSRFRRIETEEKGTPGPGEYSVEHSPRSTNQGVSMKFRHPIKSARDYCLIPGPGDYNIEPSPAISRGRYVDSKSPNSKSVKIRLPYYPPEYRSNRVTPGPGSYSPNLELSSSGQYTNSRFPDSFRAVFPRARRSDAQPRIASPGPGSYDVKGGFGIYEAMTIR